MTTGAHTTRFGKYELQERLGAGGMAVVHRARFTLAPGVSRAVVIKRVRDPYAQDPAFVEMFLNEARISMGLSHGNIVQVFDFGQEEGEYFLAMEWVDGQPLSHLLKRSRLKGLAHLPAPLAVGLVVEVCKGLHHAHTRRDEEGRPLGLVHRDVSPDNVLVSYEGEVKLADFGIAKAQLSGRPETQVGVVRGKYLYFSPEQTRAEPLDARSDVYTAGVVLFELLTGRRPVEGDAHAVMDRIARGLLTPAHQYVPELDPALASLMSRALALRRDDRFTSAEDFQRALSEWLANRAPLFPSSTLRHLMGWLFEEELKLAGQEPRIPASFLRQVGIWTGEDGPRGPEEPASASSVHRALESTEQVETEAVAPVAPVASAEPGPRGSVPVWVWGALVAVAVVAWGVWRVAAPESLVPAVHKLQVVTTPPGAEVRWDGLPAGMSPTVLEVPSGPASHRLELLFVGYQPWTTTVSASAVPERVQVALERLRPEPPPSPSVPGGVKGEESVPGSKGGPAPAPRGKKGFVYYWNDRHPEAGGSYLVGMNQLRRGNTMQARSEFKRCLELDEASVLCHLALGRMGARAGQAKEAREHYQRYLELEPQGDDAAEARRYLSGGKKGR
ncbi:protein kinase [Corallococcus sp. ZKHCc1 1396]|uniref:Protein kinase n=1 Tax=Corallococcus soli TaxID=2710757 RepID=A0ABR9PKN7_9BACT|nr:protein kinase [Corallococcus soli]